MEIRNNNPSFGMAFKTPSKGDMEAFTKYVTNDFKVSPRLAKRGLEKIVKKHADDVHFDIFFVAPREICAEPMTREAKFRYENDLLDQIPCDISVVEKYIEKYDSKEYKHARYAAKPGKKILMSLRQFADFVKTYAVLAFKPEEALPMSVRKSSLNVSLWESQIKAKEAQMTKNDQKAMKLREKNLKAIDKISSVFEPKVKTKSSDAKLNPEG